MNLSCEPAQHYSPAIFIGATLSKRIATATRNAYDARGGYAGGSVASKRFPHYWVGGFVRYDSLRGAVLDDSPLVDSQHYAAAGIATAWTIVDASVRVSTNN